MNDELNTSPYELLDKNNENRINANTKKNKYSIRSLLLITEGNLKYQKIIFIFFSYIQIFLGLTVSSLILFISTPNFLCTNSNGGNKYISTNIFN